MAEAETQPSEPSSLAEITTEIVAAYVANNAIATTDLPNLISSVGEQLARLERETAEPHKPEPAIMPRLFWSVTLISCPRLALAKC